jgi:pyrimidine-nucleoside phosphorylase
LSVYEIILAKREGGELTPEEIEHMVLGFLDGRVADYQMSAFLMAVFFRGMSEGETEALTRTMLTSGDVLDLTRVEGPKVDKHSTGGVGDKLSLIVAPVAAAAGVRVPMVSGRGLGHTGGTLDKLESIPGFRTDFSPDEFARLVDEVGMAIVGQSPRLAPADRKMYALRDVTATIECVPLIVGSILSKKLAAGLDALVLDVKVGRGAFMGDVDSGRRLARHLVGTSAKLGLPATAVLTDMNSPLGATIGNALEVAEAVDVLKGGGPADVRETSLVLASRMIMMGGLADDAADAARAAESAVADGSALAVFRDFVGAQGGDPRVVDDPALLPSAPEVAPVTAPSAGHVAGIDALSVGLAATALGAGRRTVEEDVDPSVGVEIVAPVGSSVGAGDVIARVHSADAESGAAAARRILEAFSFADEAPEPRGRLIEILEPGGGGD